MLPAGVTVRCRIRLARKAAFMRGHGRGFSREIPALARRKPAKAGSEWRSHHQALPLPDVCAAAKPFGIGGLYGFPDKNLFQIAWAGRYKITAPKSDKNELVLGYRTSNGLNTTMKLREISKSIY